MLIIKTVFVIGFKKIILMLFLIKKYFMIRNYQLGNMELTQGWQQAGERKQKLDASDRNTANMHKKSGKLENVKQKNIKRLLGTLIGS